MQGRITPENIEKLDDYQIFVFGSNEAGVHGAGAAKLALEMFGAQYRVGFGHMGKTFAIPTKDWRIKTLPTDIIEMYVYRFIDYARTQPFPTFLVTEIGCGLAGYTPEKIAPLFVDAIDLKNIWLPQRFWNVLNTLECIKYDCSL